MRPITVSEVKDSTLSDDGALISLEFGTKYVGDFGITIPSTCIDRLISVLQDAKGKLPPSNPPEPNQLRVKVPKTWAVMADAEQRGVVIVVFDHQVETRTGYALSPDAAHKMSEGLVRNAEMVLSRKSEAPSR